jgi:hypothetical protein
MPATVIRLPLPLDPLALVNRNHPLARGLMAWWLSVPHLTGGVRCFDLTGMHHGTLTAMTAAGSLTSGWGYATTRRGGRGELRFDGTDDSVDIGNPTRLQFTGAMTLCCWGRADDLTTLSSRFMAKQAASGSRSWSLHFETGAGSPYYSFQISSDGTAISTIDGGTADGPVVGQWTHLAATYAPSTALTLYKNGRQIGLNTTSIPAAQWSDELFYLGRRGAGTPLWLTGALDDCRVYNVALSAAEVSAVYDLSLRGNPGLLQTWGVPWAAAAAATGRTPIAGARGAMAHSLIAGGV